MKLQDIFEKEVFPEVKTLSAKEIADHHGVSIDSINKQLKIGINVEHEHTKDKKASREIALDHLKEDPKYYDKLKKMEAKD